MKFKSRQNKSVFLGKRTLTPTKGIELGGGIRKFSEVMFCLDWGASYTLVKIHPIIDLRSMHSRGAWVV